MKALVVLVGNYPGDQQQSMLRYREALGRDLQAAGVFVQHVVPPMVVGRLLPDTRGGLPKWLGYIDKFVIFPVVLLWMRAWTRTRHREVIFHVCDHSNAMWTRWLPRRRTVVTCHDVLAIRGARGDADTYCPASPTGKILQRWILHHLLRSRYVSSVSAYTADQLDELAATESAVGQSDAVRVVIHNGFNADFSPLDQLRSAMLLEEMGIEPGTRYLLHVGSAQLRKNRRMLADLVVELSDADREQIDAVCFAGAPVEPELRMLLAGVGSPKLVEVVRPTHEQLVALYQSCRVMVFPSFSEGFGWPIIEAQAAGAPVAASTVGPLPEVGGGGARYANPHDPGAFASVVSALLDPVIAGDATELGRQNIERYDNKLLTARYLDLYAQVLAESS